MRAFALLCLVLLAGCRIRRPPATPPPEEEQTQEAPAVATSGATTDATSDATSDAPERASEVAEPPLPPCTVRTLDLDLPPDSRCVVGNMLDAVAPLELLELRIGKQPLKIRSGQAETFLFEIHNPTDRPLRVPLPAACTAWMTVAWSKKTGQSTFETDCGGLCQPGTGMVVVLLMPGGVIQKQLPLIAERVRVAGAKCTKRDLGPLIAGNYTLEVTLPWVNPDGAPRTFTAPLEVTR